MQRKNFELAVIKLGNDYGSSGLNLSGVTEVDNRFE